MVVKSVCIENKVVFFYFHFLKFPSISLASLPRCTQRHTKEGKDKTKKETGEQIMADVATDEEADNWSDNVLTDVINKSGGGDGKKLKGAYSEIYKGLVAKLKDELKNEKPTKLSGLMSQAVVPRLIRRMANISKNERGTTKDLRSVLVNKPVDNIISADKPYPRTQIIETFVRIQEADNINLGKILKDPIGFGNPLLAAAVLIAHMAVPEGKIDLEKPAWIQKLCLRVNLIQDVIVRHLIFAGALVVPLVGDATMPTTPEARDIANANLENRALGLGENPNPEVAAILNPALVMGETAQKEYSRELGMLTELISPPGVLYNSAAAFENEGFAFSKADLPKTGKDGDGGLPSQDEEKEALQIKLNAANKKLETQKQQLQQMQKTFSDLEEKLTEAVESTKEATGKSLARDEEFEKLKEEFMLLTATLMASEAVKGTPEPKLETIVNYNLMGLEYLMSYLGVDIKIPDLVANRYELDALTTTKEEDNPINKEIDIMLGDLIQGNERLTIRRKNEKKRTYAIPKEEDRRTYVVKSLRHDEAIIAWRGFLGDTIKDDNKPKSGDLIYVRALVDATKYRVVKEKLDADLEQARAAAAAKKKETKLDIPSDSNSNSSISYKIERTQHRRRRRRNQTETERVLLW